jgi:hypothetical protein
MTEYYDIDYIKKLLTDFNGVCVKKHYYKFNREEVLSTLPPYVYLSTAEKNTIAKKHITDLSTVVDTYTINYPYSRIKIVAETDTFLYVDVREAFQYSKSIIYDKTISTSTVCQRDKDWFRTQSFECYCNKKDNLTTNIQIYNPKDGTLVGSFVVSYNHYSMHNSKLSFIYNKTIHLISDGFYSFKCDVPIYRIIDYDSYDKNTFLLLYTDRSLMTCLLICDRKSETATPTNIKIASNADCYIVCNDLDVYITTDKLVYQFR